MRLETIRIENFRGIKQVLEFPFKKGSTYTSLAIYGKNGTGKSSIVDAWEWFYDYKIHHLAREGSGEKDYPHKDTDGSNSYIEIEFDGGVDDIKFQYNHRRITQPTVTGNYSYLREKIPHPCHLRYRELQLFVYFTKAEKYEYLAKYLGFETALLIQNNLRTYSNTLQTKIDNAQGTIIEGSYRVEQELGGDTEITEENVVSYINGVCTKHKMPTIDSFKEVKRAKDALKKLVDENPKTKELAEWKELKRKLERFYPLISMKDNLDRLEILFKDLKNDKENIKNIIRIDLYEDGLEVLNKEDDKTICPLCDQKFEGDLVGHITQKHKALETLKQKLEEFQQKQSSVQQVLRGLKTKIESINEFESEIVREEVKDFFEKLKTIEEGLEEPVETLNNKISDIDELNYSEAEWIKKIDEVIIGKESLTKKIDGNIERLDEDEARKELTDDFTNVNDLATSFFQYELNHRRIEYLNSIKTIYDNVVSQYNDWIKAQIQAAFDNISGEIVEYFNLLENNHLYIKNPKIKLLTDRDKAIELEIEFAGEELSPAYKVLSESQINSFGLAVFLAAIKHFNTEFKFIILDDVINSFDTFKRPRVIKLLEKHFNDYQLLVLTHDQVWYDQLIRRFPSWNRLRFYGWDYTTGPKIEVGKDQFGQIQEDLDKDLGVAAGQKLGRYLEWILQVLNQNFQTPIKFKINNEYTLAELFSPFMKRAKDKLGNTHKVYTMLQNFDSNTGFRNFCMHWKDEQYTSDEIQVIFDSWKDIEEILTCEVCNRFVTYDSDTGYVKCPCDTLDLKDEKFKEN